VHAIAELVEHQDHADGNVRFEFVEDIASRRVEVSVDVNHQLLGLYLTEKGKSLCIET
jgi:hypothetical protein